MIKLYVYVEMGWDGKYVILFFVMFGRVIEF